jgi:hypothetical protein
MAIRRPRKRERREAPRVLASILLKTGVATIALVGFLGIAGTTRLAVEGQLTWEPSPTDQMSGDDRGVVVRERGVGRLRVRTPTIYLNGEGGVLTAGADDSSRNTSSVVAAAGIDRYENEAFRGSSARWDRIASCIRDQFSAYNVDVVEHRPTDGPYVMAMIGGQPGPLARATGHDASQAARLRGIAPLGRVPIHGAVVFVFSRSMGESTRVVCETAAQEIGHAFGLDHVLSCRDPMTHLPSCGPRSFRDEDLPCGEREARICVSGLGTQNSHRYLLDMLGPRPASVEQAVGPSRRSNGSGTEGTVETRGQVSKRGP